MDLCLVIGGYEYEFQFFHFLLNPQDRFHFDGISIMEGYQNDG